jgi:Fe2+ or Zn2+ uptake regulation protein
MKQKVSQGLYLKAELADAGFRMTKRRKAFIEIISNLDKPFSVDEMRHLLEKKDMPMHKVSLYREIERFVAQGVIRPVYLHDGLRRYEPGLDHHHHISCTNCDAIEDLRLDCEFQVAEHQLEKKTQFIAIRHSLEFFGLCKKCSSVAFSL